MRTPGESEGTDSGAGGRAPSRRETSAMVRECYGDRDHEWYRSAVLGLSELAKRDGEQPLSDGEVARLAAEFGARRDQGVDRFHAALEAAASVHVARSAARSEEPAEALESYRERLTAEMRLSWARDEIRARDRAKLEPGEFRRAPSDEEALALVRGGKEARLYVLMLDAVNAIRRERGEDWIELREKSELANLWVVRSGSSNSPVELALDVASEHESRRRQLTPEELGSYKTGVYTRMIQIEERQEQERRNHRERELEVRRSTASVRTEPTGADMGFSLGISL